MKESGVNYLTEWHCEFTRGHTLGVPGSVNYIVRSVVMNSKKLAGPLT